MVGPRHNSFHLLAACFFSVVVCLPAVAAEPPANPAVEPPRPVGQPATPPVVVPPPAPRTRIVHPQVTRLPMVRDYRSRLLGDAADVEAADAIDAALGQPVAAAKWKFTEAPLREVLVTAGEAIGVPFVIDMRAFEDSGVDLDTPITFTAQGTSARAALRQILDPIELTWMVRDESLVVTTRERANEDLAVRLYPVPWVYAETVPVDFQSLIDLVQNTVGGPAAWADGGGNGVIRPLDYGGEPVLVVSQSAEVHEQIEGLLRGLHERALAEFGGPDDIPASKTPTVRIHYVADAEIRKDLANKLVPLCNESLPYNADPEAKVTAVGECLAVQSVSPEFHALVGRLIRSVAGVKVHDEPAAMGGAAGVGGGMF
jgi:hypothetical protein